MRIMRNKNAMGHWSGFKMGLCCLVEGFIRIASLGYFFSSVCLDHTRNEAGKYFKQARKEREKNESTL